MKVLVTGATGSVGANVVKQLVEAGHAVRSQVRPSSKYLAKIERFGTELCPVDLTDRAGLIELVKGVDAVIHLAMASFGRDKLPEGLIDVNIGTTCFLLEAVKKHNPGLRRFVHASSSVVYPQRGFNTRLFTHADRQTWPVGLYAISKLASEMIVNTYHRDQQVPTVTLTVPETFCGRELLGERLPCVSPFTADHIRSLEPRAATPERDTALAALRRHSQDGKELLIPLTPEGKPWRRHLGDVRDVAAACVVALTAPKAIGGTFVIMSDALDYGIGVPHLAGVTGKKYAQEFVPFGDCYWYDLSPTENLLGFRPSLDSKQMLEDAWRHAKGEDIGIVDGNYYQRIER